MGVDHLLRVFDNLEPSWEWIVRVDHGSGSSPDETTKTYFTLIFDP